MGDPLEPPDVEGGTMHWVTMPNGAHVLVPVIGAADLDEVFHKGEKVGKFRAMDEDEAQEYTDEQHAEMSGNWNQQEDAALHRLQAGHLAYTASNMRTDLPITEENAAEVERIDSAMDKCKVPHSIKVFRWDDEEHYPNTKVGDNFRDKFHSSCSVGPEPFILSKKIPTVVLEFDVPKGTHGIFLGGRAQYSTEKELTLDRRNIWIVKNISYRPGRFDERLTGEGTYADQVKVLHMQFVRRGPVIKPITAAAHNVRKYGDVKDPYTYEDY